jgi:hypothetical protein
LFINNNKKLRVTELLKVKDLLSVSPVTSFYWQPTAANYKGIDALLFINNTLFLIQATIAWHHRVITGGWEAIKPFIGEAIRGHRVVFVYVVDDAVKGQDLCLKEHVEGFDVGYVDVSAHLPDPLKSLEVCDSIELTLELMYSHPLFHYSSMQEC